MPDSTLLITGASGFIGTHLFIALQKQGRVVQTTSRSAFSLSENHTILNLTDLTALALFLEKTKPAYIFHTAAISSIDKAEEDRLTTFNTNVAATKLMAEWSEANHCKFIHFSTDFVFDGTKRGCREEEVPNPLSYYGESKWLSEQAVQASGAECIIIRPVMVYGDVMSFHRLNFPVWLAQNTGSPLNITADQFRNPTHVSDVVHAAISLGFGESLGVYHVAGPECVSVFDFAKKVCEVKNLSDENLNSIKTSQLSAKGLRPLISCLDTSKIRNEIAFDPIGIKEGIARILL